MKTIIYAHPWDKSFNHAILESIVNDLERKKETFQIIDLYKDNFNPAYSQEELRLFSKGETNYQLVKDYQDKIKNTSELILIFPIWWFDLPAILKGFLDKVMLPHFAYSEDEDGNWAGLLTNIKKVTTITTSTLSKEDLIEYGNAIEGVLMGGTFVHLGILKQNMKWEHFSEVNRTTNEKRTSFLKEVPLLI